jgi:Flp pilus assembly protein TadG
MIALVRSLRNALRDSAGSMAVETAIVAPVLATLALGAFDASRMLSRQQQLQSAANEASEIVLAAATGTGVSNTSLESIIESSLGLTASQLTVAPRYRCSDATALVTSVPTPASGCPASSPVYTYVQLTLTETYTPVWTQFGIGTPYNYNIVRTVQIS